MGEHIFARNLNCLKSEDRIVRKKALLDIKSETDKGITHEMLSHLIRPLLGVISDPSDSVRELCVRLLNDHVQIICSQPWALQEMIAAIEGHLPEEKSEEIRLQIAKLVDSLVPHSPSIQIVIVLLGDAFPAVRHVACSCLMEKTSPREIYEHGQSILQSLIPSMTHNHSKLRKMAVSAIGSVAMHVKGDLVKDVIPHLAQRFFDPNQSVREQTTRVVGDWLLNLPDRYSYFAQLIPLMLTSMSDPHLSALSQSLWYDVGAKYVAENDEAQHHNTCSTQNIGCSLLVQRNIGRILPPLFSDLTDWLSSTRIKAAQLLPHLISNAQQQITQHVEMLANVIIRMGCDDEVIVREKAVEASEMMGYFVSPELSTNIIISHLSKNASSSLLLQSTLSAIAGIIKGSSAVGFPPFASRLLHSFSEEGVSQTGEKSIQLAVIDCLGALVDLLGDKVSLFEVVRHSMYVLAMSVDEHVGVAVRELWGKVAELEGIDFIDKYSCQLIQSLDSSTQWTDHTPQAKFFETVLTECCTLSVWKMGMPYFERNLNSSNDPAVRLRLLSLISRHLPRFELPTDFVVGIVESLVMPNIVWKAGRTASAVRIAALACLWTLLEQTVLPSKLCCDLLTLLTSCLEDHSSKSRLLSIRICGKVMNPELCQYEIFKLYENVLKRLDDSEDVVRMVVIEVSHNFFDCIRRFVFDDQQLELIYRTLLLHMDDPQSSIQQAVCDLLVSVSDVCPHVLKTELNRVAHRHRVTTYCDRLNIALN